MYESLIFDLDGTLWNASAVVVRAWNKVLTARGIARRVTRADIEGIMGLSRDDIGKKIFPQMQTEKWRVLYAALGACEQGMLAREGGRLFPAIEETLAALAAAGHRLFLVSNCDDGYIDSFYAAHGFDKYFLDYEYAGRTRKSKGCNISLVMQRNGITSAAYVGDTQGDCDAAHEAGIPFIHAAYGFGRPDDIQHVIHAPKDLLEIVKAQK